jgi:hypothetical protein
MVVASEACPMRLYNLLPCATRDQYSKRSGSGIWRHAGIDLSLRRRSVTVPTGRVLALVV